MSQVLTSSEVKKHNNKRSLWIVINNDVYDVTSYLNEHPGGEDPLLDAAGQDATRAFEDVGHSDDAREIMRKYKVGSLAKGECCSPSSASCRRKDDKKSWRTFDSPRGSGTIRNQTRSASSSRVKLPLPRVSSIVVPRESGSSSKLKWALLALGIAIIVGVSYKKYVAS